MSDNQDALRLADALEQQFPIGTAQHYLDGEAAAELRRLVAENEALKAELAEQARVNGMGSEREARLLAINAELVEALRGIVEFVDGTVEGQRPDVWAKRVNQARAALAKWEAASK